MKKLFLLLTAALCSLLSANAQKDGDMIISAGEAKHIQLGAEMNVILVPSQQEQEGITISKEVMEKLRVSFVGNTLQVKAEKNMDKQIIYVVVKDIESVTLGDNTTITCNDILKSPKIDLFINAGSQARLRTAGKIHPHALGDVEMKVTRTPVYASTSASIN